MTHEAAPSGPDSIRTAGAVDDVRAMRLLRIILGAETDALIAAAQQGSNRLRSMERSWARHVLDRLGVDMAPTGLENVDTDEQYVIVALHEGFADVLVLLQLGLDVRFAGRSELWEWPVLGDYLAAADHLQTDPERPIAAMRTILHGAPDVFAAGESLGMFAQGTVLGIEAGFQPGAFEIAKRLGRPVLPVVIAGTHRIWEHPFSPVLRFGCPIHVEVMKPMTIAEPVADMHRLQTRMKASALRQLRAAPRRFVPERDGIWPDHTYTIDPSFPATARRVKELRHEADGEASA